MTILDCRVRRSPARSVSLALQTTLELLETHRFISDEQRQSVLTRIGGYPEVLRDLPAESINLFWGIFSGAFAAEDEDLVICILEKNRDCVFNINISADRDTRYMTQHLAITFCINEHIHEVSQFVGPPAPPVEPPTPKRRMNIRKRKD